MKQANGVQRFLAWLIDFSLLIPIYFLSFKVIEKLLLTYRHYPPLKRRGMIAFTPAEFETFFLNVLFILVLAVIIKSISYFNFNQTIGEKLIGIRRFQPDGEQLERNQRRKLVLVSIIKISAVCLPGPLFSFIYLALNAIFKLKLEKYIFFFSLTLLIVAFFFFTISPLIAYFKEDKVSWVEKFTNTRVFKP